MPPESNAIGIAIAEIKPSSTADIESHRSSFDFKSFVDNEIHKTLANSNDVNITRPNVICN